MATAAPHTGQNGSAGAARSESPVRPQCSHVGWSVSLTVPSSQLAKPVRRHFPGVVRLTRHPSGMAGRTRTEEVAAMQYRNARSRPA